MNRKLDVLIAEKVFKATVKHVDHKFGWRVDYLADNNDCNVGIPTDMGFDGYRLKYYSTRIEHAWEILNHFNSLTEAVTISVKQAYDGAWRCEIQGSGSMYFYGVYDGSQTPTEAICNAAIMAAKSQVDDRTSLYNGS